MILFIIGTLLNRFQILNHYTLSISVIFFKEDGNLVRHFVCGTVSLLARLVTKVQQLLLEIPEIMRKLPN